MSVDGARRTEILDTAAALFASSGLRTSLKEIADACGILPGSLYHHFESKEAIIVELVERYHADLDAIASEALADARAPDAEPVADRIVALGSAIAALRGPAPSRAAADRLRAAVGRERPAGRASRSARRARSSTAMLETLRAGRANGDIRPGIDLETLADRLCQVLLHVSLGRVPRRAGRRPGAGDPLPDRAGRRRGAIPDRRRARPLERLRGRRARPSTTGTRATRTRTSGSRCSEPWHEASSVAAATRRRRSATSPRPRV